MLGRRRRRQLIIALLTVGIAIGAGRAYYRLTDDFRRGNITQNLPYHPEWQIPPLTPLEKTGLDKILDQKFTYLGKGAQSYAFLSADGDYVLKLFKYKHARPSFWMDWLPPLGSVPDYQEAERKRKKEKLESTLNGYKLAYDVHREESGLLFIHLNPTDSLNKVVTLTDKIGRQWQIDLDPVVFIVQHKAKKLRKVIADHLDKGEVEVAKQKARQIFDLYQAEYAKGIYDRDHGVMHNTGFVGETPIHLDTGKMSPKPSASELPFIREDLLKVALKFKLYIQKSYPQHYDEMVRDIEAKLSEIFGEPFQF